MPLRAKLAAALVLAACLALPMSTCTRHLDARGEPVALEPAEPVPEGVTTVVERHVPIAQLPVNPIGGAAILVAFLWPLGFALYQARGRSARGKAVLFWLEPPLLAGTAHYVATLASFGDPAWGAALAAGALSTLALLWLVELLRRGRRRFALRTSAPRAPAA